jgi:hypothetical protein
VGVLLVRENEKCGSRRFNARSSRVTQAQSVCLGLDRDVGLHMQLGDRPKRAPAVAALATSR